MLHEHQSPVARRDPGKRVTPPAAESPVVALQRLAGNAAVARAIGRGGSSPLLMRTLIVDGTKYGDTARDEQAVWDLVKPLVAGAYGRRKALKAMFAQNLANNWPVAELAAVLDEPYIRKQGRGRPTWTPRIVKWLSDTAGGTSHRRHIVMSSVIRDAVYAVSDGNVKTESDAKRVAAVYSDIVALVSKRAHDSLPAAEADLVSLLHNNPANLITDKGNWNSAIGMIAQQLKGNIQNSAALWNGIKDAPADKIGDLLDKVPKGFQIDIQHEIIEFWKDYAKKNPPESADDLRDLFEDMFDNAAVDLMTKKSTKDTPMGPLLNCHMMFVEAQSSMDLKKLVAAATEFINIGLSNQPSYTDVWP